jgi:hypothetical protein
MAPQLRMNLLAGRIETSGKFFAGESHPFGDSSDSFAQFARRRREIYAGTRSLIKTTKSNWGHIAMSTLVMSTVANLRGRER